MQIYFSARFSLLVYALTAHLGVSWQRVAEEEPFFKEQDKNLLVLGCSETAVPRPGLQIHVQHRSKVCF